MEVSILLSYPIARFQQEAGPNSDSSAKRVGFRFIPSTQLTYFMTEFRELSTVECVSG